MNKWIEIKNHKETFFYALSGNFLKKSWFKSSLIFTLSIGFFCKHLSKKSLAYPETYTYEGIYILSFTIFINSSSFVILNGFYPTNI